MGTYANPTVSIPDIAAIQDAASEVVSARFESGLAAAESAAAAAEGFLSSLGGVGSPPFVNFTPSFSMPAIPSVNADIPEPNIQSFSGRGQSIGFTMENFALILGNAPNFDIAPLIPIIPVFPDLVFPELTETRPFVRDVVLPDEPVLVFPDPPVMNEIVLPPPISIDLPTFDAILPVENIAIPSNVIDPGIFNYDSPILQMLKDKVLQWITTSGTGLDPIIEQAIYDRDNERAILALEEARQNAIDEWSKRGFILPNGVLAANIMQLEIDHKNKRLDTSRDIIINQAKLAQENTHFYIQQALTLETQLMSWTNLLGQRTFEASKASMDAAISITQVDISRYNVRLQVYQVQAQVYETRIKSELAKVEIYKTQIEAASLTAETNKVAAEVYKIRTEAIQALITIYEARIKAAMATLEVDKAKIDGFQSLVQAYISQINGITAKFGAYNTRIEGEKTKASIYSSQVDAWKSRVEAFKVEAEVQIEKAKVVVARNEVYVKKYGVDIERDKVEVMSSAEHAKAESEAFQAHVLAHKARAEAQAAAANAALKSAEIQIEASIRIADGVRNAQEANMRGFIAMQTLRTEAAKGGAAVAAQMAAGAFAGMSISAQIGAHAQAAQTYTGHESLSESHNFQHTP